MEYVEGETLADRLARDGALLTADTFGILEAICSGLSAAHAIGVVHVT